MLAYGWVVQKKLHALAETTYRASAVRNSTLVEALTGIETIKSQGAESLIQARWERTNVHLAATNVKMRGLSSGSIYITSTIAQLMSVVLVIVGVYLIGDKTLTMGALIAVNMLAGRAMAPAGQIVGLLMQYQGARTALAGLERIMKTDVERPKDATFVERRDLDGAIEFRNVAFHYPNRKENALDGVSFKIKPGEKVALIGRVGSGKSTIQRLAMGLFQPTGRRRAGGRHRPAPDRPGRPAPQHGLRVAGRAAVLRQPARQHRVRHALRRGRRDRRRRRGGRPGRHRQPPSARLRHGRGRARRVAVGRPAPERGHRARGAAQRADAAARRADQRDGLSPRRPRSRSA